MENSNKKRYLFHFLAFILTLIALIIFLLVIILELLFGNSEVNLKIVGILIPLTANLLFYLWKRLNGIEKDILNQIKVLNLLISNLEEISSINSNTYLGETIGNLEWYFEEIAKDRKGALDHQIAKLDKEILKDINPFICKNINLKKLMRSIQYLGNKLEQIMNNVNKTGKNFNKNYIIGIIIESQRLINAIKNDLQKQIQILCGSI
ncbi:MAG: hypothetical protein OQK82_00585 [Candidatus Pacearchaeota archaeon]|nr:hypothetical protein [Candidatus Pacearchaeota archaeon]